MTRCRGFRFFAVGVCWLIAHSAAADQGAHVPKPYTPVEASADRFGCLGRVTELGELLLPKQITAAGKPLLAAPVRLSAEPDFLSGLNGRSHVVRQAADTATWNWDSDSADVNVHAVMTGDCDGFCWYEVHLAPKHPLAIRSLMLDVPRIAVTARYLHTANLSWSNVSRGIAEIGGKWSGAFWPYVWIGDEERGLAWSAESPAGWKLAHPQNTLGVETREDAVHFHVALVDHPIVLAKPLVLRFGFQASPVKPVSLAWRTKFRVVHDIQYDSCVPGPNGRCELDDLRDGGAKAVIIHDSWTAYFGQTTPADKLKLRRLIDACHKRGLKLLVYVGYGLARNSKEIQGHHDQWSVMPLVPWDPSYKPQTRGFDACCPRSGWADWLVDGIDRLFAHYDLDGLYLDSTSETFPCSNTDHGCGWKDELGRVQPVYPMLSTRRLMRRISDVVHEHNPQAILDAHMSGNMTLQTLSFCDSVWDGEQFSGHGNGEKFTVPLDMFRTEFMGYAHGLDSEFLCYENRPFTFDEAIALAWVHGVEVRPYPQTLKKVTPIWRALDRFGVVDAAWHPYWSDALASADHDGAKISGWIRDGKTLLFISHLQRTSAVVHVRLNPRWFPLDPSTLRATDAITNQNVPIDHDTFSISFDGMAYKMVNVTP